MPNNVSTVQRARDRRLKTQAARSTMTTTSPAYARIERSPTGETFASLGAGSEGNESRRGAFFVVCLFFRGGGRRSRRAWVSKRSQRWCRRGIGPRGSRPQGSDLTYARSSARALARFFPRDPRVSRSVEVINFVVIAERRYLLALTNFGFECCRLVVNRGKRLLLNIRTIAIVRKRHKGFPWKNRELMRGFKLPPDRRSARSE